MREFYPRQANSWEDLNPSGSLPAARYYSVGIWSNPLDGFFIYSGDTSSLDLRECFGWLCRGFMNDVWFYNRQAGLADRFESPMASQHRAIMGFRPTLGPRSVSVDLFRPRAGGMRPLAPTEVSTPSAALLRVTRPVILLCTYYVSILYL